MRYIMMVVAVAATFYSLTVQAQDTTILRLNRFLEMVEQEEMVMGNISVFHSGKEICSKAIGFRDLEQGIRADLETRYRVGSVSKTFCAVVILRLVEEGKLSLQDRLSRFFPSVQGSENISIEQMMRHRSGLKNFLETPDYIHWKQQVHTREQLLIRIETAGLSFDTPDSKAEYSNSNYALLAMIAEQVSGKSYSALVREYITDPLGLSATRAEGNIEPKENEALSYRRSSEWSFAGYTDSSILLGAGDVISTPTELNKFISALMSGRLLSSASLVKMLELKEKYGMGILPLYFNDKVAYGHTGGIDGYASALFYFPDSGYSYAYTFNGVQEDLSVVVAGLVSAIYDMPWQKPQSDDPSTYHRYEGIYVSSDFPLPIFIGVQEGKLMAQALGQSSFPLKGAGKGVFVFVPAAIRVIFEPEKDEMLFLQGGFQIRMKKMSKQP